MEIEKSEESRSILITLFSEKSNAHIGYLIATALALIGTLNTTILTTIGFSNNIFLIIFVIIMFYFLGRVLLYSYLIESVIRVQPYTIAEFEKFHKDAYNKVASGIYNTNSIFLLYDAVFDLTLRKLKYESNPCMEKFVYIARWFNGKKLLCGISR